MADLYRLVPWGRMFRIISILTATMALAGCSGIQAEVATRHQAMLDANKIPEVQLRPEQVAALTKKIPHVRQAEMRVSWVQAGRQNNGSIFVCYVTKVPDLFGVQEHIGVHTGTFEADGSFRPSAVPLLGEGNPVHNCWAKGFSPPVRMETVVVPMRI
jgi:hypothetical protein